MATARDLGAGGGDAETARAFAARISEREAFAGDAAARTALLRLRDAVERERYGRAGASPGPGLAEDLVAARTALLADARGSGACEGRAGAPLAVRPGAQGARRPARGRGVESSIVAIKHSPFRVNVRDLVNRPGDMREQHLAIAVAEPMGEGLVAAARRAPSSTSTCGSSPSTRASS